jgi:hypothetical protein
MSEPIDLNNVPEHLIERARTERLKRQQMEDKLNGPGDYGRRGKIIYKCPYFGRVAAWGTCAGASLRKLEL